MDQMITSSNLKAYSTLWFHHASFLDASDQTVTNSAVPEKCHYEEDELQVNIDEEDLIILSMEMPLMFSMNLSLTNLIAVL